MKDIFSEKGSWLYLILLNEEMSEKKRTGMEGCVSWPGL